MPTGMTRTTVHLFDEDATYLKSIYGYGWSEQVRIAVREWCKRRKEAAAMMKEAENEE